MHPFLLRRERLLAYILGWLGFALLASLAVSSEDAGFVRLSAVALPIALLYAFISLSTWYICRSLPLSDTPVVRLIIVQTAVAFVGGAIVTGLVLGWNALLGELFGWSLAAGTSAVRILFISGVILNILGIVFHYALMMFENSRATERSALEAQLLARASELKALRSQIDPHFLYNSLNSISALIPSDPERARTMTVQLADFFRASVAAGAKHLIPFSQEQELLSTYFAIERVRYGQRLAIDMDIHPEAETVLVPPLILQPLAENAIKHGIARLVDGGAVSLRARRTGGVLVVEMRNPIDPDERGSRPAGTSFGLKVVRDRLAAAGGQQGRLTIRTDERTFIATVEFPADP